MNRLSIAVVKAGMLMCASWLCAPAAATPSEQAACAAALRAIQADDPAFDRLERIYRRHLRFGGTAHRILPHFHATYEDIVAARNETTVQDIPYMVHELARTGEANARQTVAIGVLGQFGQAALPCLDAAMEDPQARGRRILTQIRIGIAAAQAATARAQ